MTKRVLIVDDQPGIRLLLHEIVVNEGHDVTTAKTGKEALDLLQSHTFDLMMLDYKLPVMNGVEVLQLTAEHNIHLPVIMITGMQETVLEEVSEKELEVMMLSKPFNAEDVSALIRKTLIEA